jgi:hypothetical protein
MGKRRTITVRKDFDVIVARSYVRENDRSGAYLFGYLVSSADDEAGRAI